MKAITQGAFARGGREQRNLLLGAAAWTLKDDGHAERANQATPIAGGSSGLSQQQLAMEEDENLGKNSLKKSWRTA